jgi:glucokinase
MSNIVSLDVGGTSIKSGVVSLSSLGPAASAGTPADAVQMGPSLPTRSTESAEVVVAQLVQAVTTALGVAGPDVVGLAIGFPGPFDIAGGRALIRGLHKFESIYGLDLRAELRAELRGGLRASRSGTAELPIEFARDSEAAGTGEAVFGSGRTGTRVLTVTIGTGLGSCLTDMGRVVEIVGDLEVEKLAQRTTPDGRADDVLSARGLADRLGVETSALQSLVDEPTASAAIRDHGRRLGAFLAPVVDELDVDLVVVGGGLVAAFDLFEACLQAELGSTPCEPAILGAKGPLLGAALLTFPDEFPPGR